MPLGRPVELEGVQVSYFPSRFLRRLYWSPAMGRALAGVASFDVVHLHSVFLWPTWAAARAARAARVPYVLAPRGMLVPELIRSKSRWAKSAWIRSIERRNLVGAEAIHATSDVESQDLARFGWRLPRVVVIPNGVDEPAETSGRPISADVSDAIAGGDYVLSLGRMVWKKGLDRLVAALPAVPKTRLILAGDDPEGYAALLSREALRLGVADRVSILPRHVEGADKEALFAGARMFAMPSLSENFGLAAVEAMRRGSPVLVTPEVGVAGLVRASGGGIVVDGNADAVSCGLDRLLGDPGALKAMGAAGQAYVSARYDWGAVAQRMEKLYASIVAGRA